MKALWWVLGILVVLIVGLAGYLVIAGNSIIRQGIETYGPELTGTSVKLKSVTVMPIVGRATLKGLEVGNPKGFKSANAFEIGEAAVGLETRSLLSDTVHIHEIRIADPIINFEMARGTNNLEALQRSVEKSAERWTAEGKKNEIDVIVDSVLITGARVNVAGLPVGRGENSVELPDIHVTGLGSKEQGGVTPEIATRAVTRAVTQAAIKIMTSDQAQKLLRDAIRDPEAMTDRLKGLIEGLGGGRQGE